MRRADEIFERHVENLRGGYPEKVHSAADVVHLAKLDEQKHQTEESKVAIIRISSSTDINDDAVWRAAASWQQMQDSMAYRMFRREAVHCAAYLSTLGYKPADAEQWQVCPASLEPGGVQVNLTIAHESGLDGMGPAHVKKAGYTWYRVFCTMGPTAGGTSLPPFRWCAPRHLVQMRESLHAPVKEMLGQEYQTYFSQTRFARLGGPPGTTARLREWLATLASMINKGDASPALAALTLHFFQAPAIESQPLGAEALVKAEEEKLAAEAQQHAVEAHVEAEDERLADDVAGRVQPDVLAAEAIEPEIEGLAAKSAAMEAQIASSAEPASEAPITDKHDELPADTAVNMGVLAEADPANLVGEEDVHVKDEEPALQAGAQIEAASTPDAAKAHEERLAVEAPLVAPKGNEAASLAAKSQEEFFAAKADVTPETEKLAPTEEIQADAGMKADGATLVAEVDAKAEEERPSEVAVTVEVVGDAKEDDLRREADVEVQNENLGIQVGATVQEETPIDAVKAVEEGLSEEVAVKATNHEMPVNEPAQDMPVNESTIVQEVAKSEVASVEVEEIPAIDAAANEESEPPAAEACKLDEQKGDAEAGTVEMGEPLTETVASTENVAEVFPAAEGDAYAEQASPSAEEESAEKAALTADVVSEVEAEGLAAPPVESKGENIVDQAASVEGDEEEF